jgi:hypothetical protein
MFGALELVGYRIEDVEGSRYSIQLFDNGALIYKTFEGGVRNGVSNHCECFKAKGTDFWKRCKTLIREYRFLVQSCPDIPEGFAVREALVCLGKVSGSLFLHKAEADYSHKYFQEMKIPDFQAALGDFADSFKNAFFEAYPTLERIEKTDYSDFLDPFIEEDLNRLRIDSDPNRTNGYEKALRPCLNSYCRDEYLETKPSLIAGQIEMENFLDQNLLKLVKKTKNQEDFDKRIARIMANCHRIYKYRYLFDEDLDLLLSKLLLAFAIRGQIKSCTLLRWLRPDYRDVVVWDGEKNFYYGDYFVSLKYYRWKSEKEKCLPILFYQSFGREGNKTLSRS